MSVSRWERAVPLAGAVFAVLYFVGQGLIGEVGRTSTPSAERIEDLLSDRAPLRLVGVYLSLVAIPFLMLFAAYLYRLLRTESNRSHLLPALSLAGAAIVAAVLLVAFAAIGQATIRADSSAGLGPESGVVLYDLYRGVLVVSGMGFALFVGAVSMESFRTGVFPRWLSWAGGVVALGLISPGFFFFAFIAILWVLVVSGWLFRAALRSPSSASG